MDKVLEQSKTIQTNLKQISDFLQKYQLWWSTCESFTGGGFASAITDLPGASKAFWGGFVTYSPEAKIKLGVPERVIKKDGLVSKATAIAMCEATFEKSKTSLVISFTGHSGPTVQDINGLIGQAFVGCLYQGHQTVWSFYYPHLDRLAFKKQIMLEVSQLIWDVLSK